MPHYYLKEFASHKDYNHYVSQKEIFTSRTSIVGYCRAEKEMHFHVSGDPPADLYFWWSGADAPTSGKWKDRIRNAEWNIVGGTWDSENMWYQFLNPTTTQQYATYTGTIPNFGYHWKVQVDCEVRPDGNPSNAIMDFSSIGGVGTNKSGFSIGHNPSSNAWTSNSKLNGNGSASTYRPANLVDAFETGVWYPRIVSIGIRASETAGKDEMFISVEGVGESKTPTPFTPISITPNGCGDIWHISRGWISSAGTGSSSIDYYRSSVRIKDIKIYTCRENYEV